MTFSIVGRCERTGELGAAVASSSIAIGNRCPRVRSGVGAVLTQSAAAPVLAESALDLLQSGLDPTSALNLLTGGREYIDYRQVLMVSHAGQTGHYTGEYTRGEHATCEGKNAIAGMCGSSFVVVPGAMIVAFEQQSAQSLASRLIGALEAGVRQVGEGQGVHSASLLVTRDQKWPFVDLRVDWHQSAPVKVLRGLWEAYKVEADVNVARALRPGSEANTT